MSNKNWFIRAFNKTANVIDKGSGKVRRGVDVVRRVDSVFKTFDAYTVDPIKDRLVGLFDDDNPPQE